MYVPFPLPPDPHLAFTGVSVVLEAALAALLLLSGLLMLRLGARRKRDRVSR